MTLDGTGTQSKTEDWGNTRGGEGGIAEGSAVCCCNAAASGSKKAHTHTCPRGKPKGKSRTAPIPAAVERV